MPPKVAKKTIGKALRVNVWNTNGGKDVRNMPCYANCGTSIDITSFECGHVIAESKGGDTCLENLKPICGLCNKSMGCKNMDEFRIAMGYLDDDDEYIETMNNRLDIATKDAEINTAYPDGTKAEISAHALSQLGLTHASFDFPERKNISVMEMMRDRFTYMEIMHKYKICHRKDFAFSNSRVTKVLNACKSVNDIETEWNKFCTASKKDGDLCTNKAKIGGLCTTHAKK